MQWQLYIYTKLNLEDKTPTVISDYTGILTSHLFLSLLDEKAVSYLVTNKVPEMLSASGTMPILIILTNIKDVPAFITNKFQHKQFTYADIPLNGDIAGILKGQSAESIIQLLNYVYDTDIHQVVTKYNIKDFLSFAKSHAGISAVSSLIEQITLLLQTLPQFDSILKLGKLWGKLVYLSVIHQDTRYENYVKQVDAFAASFIHSDGMRQAAFASTLKNPKSVDRILSSIKSQNNKKIALICFDCMGFAEWYLLQDYLSVGNFNFTDIALFTMLPSVTSVSRTAIFHGSQDVYNIKSPGRSDEARAFANYFNEKEVEYFTESDAITEDTLLGYDCISILYTFFDDLSHSAQFPPNHSNKSLYFDAVKGYLNKSKVLQTFRTLQSNDFTVYICSDHGSVVAFGNGQKLDKYLIDNFAKRAVIVPAASADLIENTKIKIPFVEGKIIVLPEGRAMFANKNQIEINHGGITVEEIVVPYIKMQGYGDK
jgi:hypothetical protein